MPGPNLGLASHEPIDEQEPASDATQTSGGEDAREPGPQTRSAARARVGFALDVANSGARFVTDVVPDQAPVSSFLGFTHRRLH
ncbi:hypothetical protein DIPPA_27890 [Diplonema papillatum]|nr:hypothetical protein DIPPA_27890 [Diplonema papillatum]